jgi:hypothetical protein
MEGSKEVDFFFSLGFYKVWGQRLKGKGWKVSADTLKRRQ